MSAGLGPFQSDVTARTSAVDGTADVAAVAGGDVLTRSQFTAQTAQLSTGDGTLDDQTRRILETDRYPTSQFEQTGTVQLPSASAMRAGARITLPGNLTLHGVTRSVTVAADLTLVGQRMIIDAIVPFRLADYDIRGNGLVTVGDAGTMSFHLALVR